MNLKMASNTPPFRNQDQLTFDQTGWPVPYPQLLQAPSTINNGIMSFLVTESISSASFSDFETPSDADINTCNVLEPAQPMDETALFPFVHSQLSESCCESNWNSFLCGSTPANEQHATHDSTNILRPRTTGSLAAQESNNIAGIGSTICSLISEHLDRLSNTRTSKPPVLQCDTSAANGLNVASRGRQSSKTSKHTKSTVKR